MNLSRGDESSSIGTGAEPFNRVHAVSFMGNLIGNVTGNVTGNTNGTHTGDVNSSGTDRQVWALS